MTEGSATAFERPVRPRGERVATPARVASIVLTFTAYLVAAVPARAETQGAPLRQQPVTAVGRWVKAPAPAVHRSSDHTATLLRDGRVLVVGGLTPNPANGVVSKDAYTSAELFDPSTGRWSATGSLAVMRQYDTATLLSDGRVLVVGGYHVTGNRAEPSDFIAAVEIYDPASGRWSTTGSLAVGRFGHTATLLRDGRVLVAGGVLQQPTQGAPGMLAATDTAEIWDPATGRWTATGRMPAGRWEHTATLLDDGTVLVAGGRNALAGHALAPDGKTFVGTPALQDALIFDPRTGTWTTVPHLMGSPRTAHTATLLADGTVLIAGGSSAQDHFAGGVPVVATEIYVPGTKTFDPAQSMLQGSIAPTATRLPDGRVLLAGGYAARRYASQGGTGAIETVKSAELYLPSTGRWVFASTMLAPPNTIQERDARIVLLAGHHTATLLSGAACGRLCGEVMVIGGDSTTAAAQLFDPAERTTGSAPTARVTEAGALAGAGAAVALLAVLTTWRVRRRRGRDRG